MVGSKPPSAPVAMDRLLTAHRSTGSLATGNPTDTGERTHTHASRRYYAGGYRRLAASFRRRGGLGRVRPRGHLGVVDRRLSGPRRHLPRRVVVRWPTRSPPVVGRVGWHPGGTPRFRAPPHRRRRPRSPRRRRGRGRHASGPARERPGTAANGRAATRSDEGDASGFGYLGCREEVVGFYERVGWHRIDQKTREIDPESREWTLSEGPTLILPATAPLSAWPRAGTIDLRGMWW